MTVTTEEKPRSRAKQREMVAFRVPSEQLAEIKKRQVKAGVTFTDFMIRSALGLPMTDKVQPWERRLEARIRRIESALGFEE